MKRLEILLILITMRTLNSCVVRKEINVTIIDSEKVEVKPNMFGSTFDDVKPELKIPFLP